MPGKPTVILESGAAASYLTWLPLAQLLDLNFRVIIHRRANTGDASLPSLARQLRAALHRSHVPPPYILIGHSFGALVIRQFAAQYREVTAGLLFLDGLPPPTQPPPIRLAAAITAARLCQILATLGLLSPVLPQAAKRLLPVTWAIQELQKLPKRIQPQVIQEWLSPGFYSDLARILAALRTNLQIACSLPDFAPSLSLHSDYPDPQGERVDRSGHWIQVDQPAAVAAAVDKLHAIIRQKGV